MNDPVNSNPSPSAGPRRRRGLLIAGAVLGVLALGVATKAYVYARGAGWHHGWGGGSMNPELISDRIEHGVKYVLSDVDATADQKAKVTAILQDAATDVYALRGQHLAAREQIHALFSAPSVDRTRLETLRTEEMQLADQASKRVVAGIADAAEVLTPEQRTSLLAKMEQRHRWRQGDE